MVKTVVFDFDKTLTDYDTIFPFYLFCCNYKPYKYLLVPIFIFIKFCSKANLISVKTEKEIGLKFFCARNIDDFKIQCIKFSKRLKLNKLYFTTFCELKNNNEKIIIASGSFQYYIEAIFPNIKVLGTTVRVDLNGNIIGINQHPFKNEKSILLKSLISGKINIFYTDSKNDLATSLISEKTIWIKRGEIIQE